MSIIMWLCLGLFSGFIASKIVNRSGSGLLLDVALGAAGSFVGGIVFSWVGYRGVTGLNLWSVFVSVVGAVLVLVAYHLVVRRGRV